MPRLTRQPPTRCLIPLPRSKRRKCGRMIVGLGEFDSAEQEAVIDDSSCRSVGLD